MVMADQCTNPPVEMRTVTTVSFGNAWISSFYYYWYFTNPPAALAERKGCTQ